MDLSGKNIKKLLGIACACILFYWCLNHFDRVAAGLAFLGDLLLPFVLGCIMAFIVNVAMRPLEELLARLFGLADDRTEGGASTAEKAGSTDKQTSATEIEERAGNQAALAGARGKKGFRTDSAKGGSGKPRSRKWLRPLALALTVFLFCLVVALVVSIVVPELYRTFQQLFRQIPIAVHGFYSWISGLSVTIPGGVVDSAVSYLEGLDWAAISRQALTVAKNVLSGLAFSGIGVISGVVGTVTSFGIGLIFSVYLLTQKEQLAGQGKQLLYAYLPRKRAEQAVYVLQLTNQTFSRFVRGQCLEAFILACMFFVSMSLLRMPYTLLVSVVICVTALIPILGSFIGCAVGIFLIAIVSPVQALGFLALFLVLQQIEGNLIYPHVVGSSIGLPGIWTLAAVTVGGGLMGVAGMLLFIPLSSVLYQLLRENTKRRLKERGIGAAELEG